MARNGLFSLLCAGLVILCGPLPRAWNAPETDRDDPVAAALAVQTALQQGQEHMLRKDFKSAVYALESQVERIKGNPAYLAMLRDAYRGYIQELRLTNQTPAAELYQKRLRILDPGSVLDQVMTRGAQAPATAADAVPTVPPRSARPEPVRPEDDTERPRNAAPPAAPPGPKVRAKRADEDDGSQSHQIERQKAAQGLVLRAEEEFGRRRYQEAGSLYEQAHQMEPNTLHHCRERWAYCKLSRVVEQINQPPTGGPPWQELEQEIRKALELAPRLEYGKTLLGEIQKRKGTAPSDPSSIAVHHTERGSDGWARVETTNFRIFHNQPREFAEQAARVAEQTRLAMFRKWFGTAADDWKPRCEIYLHATGQDYSRVTGVPANSPGHSSIKSENGRVVGRKIDLHCDDLNLLTAVLPHETTHVVLAGQFGEHQVPRWADEGISVLTEPREKVERHLRNLPRCRQENQLFTIRQLMELPDYPDPRFISAFYAQSVSLVDFLANKRGPQVLTQFLRDGLRGGYEQSLTRHYGYRNFDELQQQWSQASMAGLTGTGIAQRNP